jgi:hypothetical protein
MFGPPRYTDPPDDPLEGYRDHVDGMSRAELTKELATVEADMWYPDEEWSSRTLDSLHACRAILLEALAGFKYEEEDDDESSPDS